MEQPLTYLQQRVNQDWLIGGDSRTFDRLVEQRSHSLAQWPAQRVPRILLAESDPVKFLAGFMAACAANCPVFLGNSNWVQQEWQQVWELVQPDLVWGDGSEAWQLPPGESGECPAVPSGSILIPTGGSSGQIRFVIHTWSTLMASVAGFRQYFQVDQVNSVCVLPLYHVSGLMQFLRSLTSGGKLAVLPFKTLESELPDLDPTEFFISLVPTQLQRLLQQPVSQTWLSRFRTVLLGGAPAWPELFALARRHQISLAPTYGMTETASQIVTLKPADFLKGNNSCGQVLPHASLAICSSNQKPLAPGQIGAIAIQADSLALGYYPQGAIDQQCFQPDDLGWCDAQGYLTVVGRQSQKIITGGENVFPAEVEAAILATNLVKDVCVIGLPDRHWGEVVTAIYRPTQANCAATLIHAALSDRLCSFKRPKHWIPCQSFPRNAQGKVNRLQLQQIAMTWLQQHSSVTTNG